MYCCSTAAEVWPDSRRHTTLLAPLNLERDQMRSTFATSWTIDMHPATHLAPLTTVKLSPLYSSSVWYGVCTVVHQAPFVTNVTGHRRISWTGGFVEAAAEGAKLQADTNTLTQLRICRCHAGKMRCMKGEAPCCCAVPDHTRVMCVELHGRFESTDIYETTSHQA